MINKVIQYVLCGLLSLAVALPIALPAVAQMEGMSSMGMDGMRKKRYRYRKRTHRVQVGLNFVPWNQDKSTDFAKNLKLDLDLLYGYNLGYLEFGPNVSIQHQPGSNFNVQNMAIGFGAWAEGNFIKNTRKKKLIPALGLKANYVREGAGNNLLLSPYVAIKLFPASRTGLVLNLGFDYQTPFKQFFKSNFMGLNVSLNYAHYFHF